MDISKILEAPADTLVPVGWVRKHFLPEPSPELLRYRLAVATAATWFAAVARGDLPATLWRRGPAARQGIVKATETPDAEMAPSFSKSIGERGARVRVFQRPGSRFLYLEWWEEDRRIQKAIKCPLTGHGITNRQLAVDIATGFQIQRAADLVRSRLEARREELVAEGLGDLLPPVAVEVPAGVQVYTDLLVPEADDADLANIRLEEAWDHLASLPPTGDSKHSTLGEIGDFRQARNGSVKFLGNPRLRDLTQADVYRYEKHLREEYSPNTARKRTHVYLRMLFEHFEPLVPSIRDLKIQKVKGDRRRGGRYLQSETERLENHLHEIHPDAADVFRAMLEHGWRIGMARQIEGRELRFGRTASGEDVAIASVDIRKVKQTSDVLAAFDKGDETWSFLVTDPRTIRALRIRKERFGDGPLFPGEKGGFRDDDWYRDELERLEVAAGVPRVKGRSTHALKREFASRSKGRVDREATSRTSTATLDGIYAQGGERDFSEAMKNWKVTLE